MRDPDREAFLERDRRDTNELLARMRALRESWAAAAEKPVPRKSGSRCSSARRRVGVDTQAQKLLAERGVQRVQAAATFDQYRLPSAT
jgi:hypothetical protein